MPRLLILIAALAGGYWYLTDSGTHRLRFTSPGFGAGPIMGGAAGQSIGGAALGVAGRISP